MPHEQERQRNGEDCWHHPQPERGARYSRKRAAIVRHAHARRAEPLGSALQPVSRLHIHQAAVALSISFACRPATERQCFCSDL